jgi:hypothetical protein
MLRIAIVLLMSSLCSQNISFAQLQTLFEKSNGKKTDTYQQVIAFYEQLDKISSNLVVRKMGPSDAGFPLHLVLYSADGQLDPVQWKKQKKVVILINNGIHPGEPDGIDASMMMLRDLVYKKINLPPNVVLAVIPLYNIGGSLNRSSYYRVDQNGPDDFGSRGNSQNLDLNRDFIKSDSKEARSFATIFHTVDPDIFVDNHVSNGADYQHVMTLLTTQHNKLGGETGRYLETKMEPGLYSMMKEKGYHLVPYVNAFGDTPESGWPQFYDGPRYSSGYAALWQCFSFVPETHMLKPYPQRVEATYQFMQSAISFASKERDSILAVRKKDRDAVIAKKQFDIKWKQDRSQYKTISFHGFESGKKPSEISGKPRFFYDRSKPFIKEIKFYHTYTSALSIEKPEAYIIPQGWWKVIDLLQLNKVKMRQLSRDTTMTVEVYRISSYKSSPRPFEMHHMNTEVQVTKQSQSVSFRKGDWFIPMNQTANRFIIEVLEPQSDDSYFTWNYFDGILGQKEGYSSYVFEETASAYLKENPKVQALLNEKKLQDSAFANNGAAQLQFVFEHSPYFEPDYLRYPVYRLVK